MLIEAYDNAGAATRSSTGTLTVTVNRNLFAPFFTTDRYTKEILEIQEVGVPFEQILAQDDDTVVSYCLLSGTVAVKPTCALRCDLHLRLVSIECVLF